MDLKSDHLNATEQNLQVMSDADTHGLHRKIDIMSKQMQMFDRKIESVIARYEGR